MKKSISVMLIVLMLVGALIPCINATENAAVYSNKETASDEDVSYPSGNLPDDAPEVNRENIKAVISPASWGDLNGDNKVAANDARLCLRAAAQLEKLTDAQLAAADIFATNTVTAANARKILRVAATLDTFDSDSIILNLGEGIIIETPESDDPEYQWVLYLSQVGFGNTRDVTGEEHEKGLITETDGNRTSVFADTLGNYILSFYLENKNRVQKASFRLKINVRTDSHITMNVGESFELPALWINSGTPAEWVCKVNDESGLAVESDMHIISEFSTNKYGEPIPNLFPLVYYFTFTAQKKGTYEVEMIYKYTFMDTPEETLHFTVEVV